MLQRRGMRRLAGLHAAFGEAPLGSNPVLCCQGKTPNEPVAIEIPGMLTDGLLAEARDGGIGLFDEPACSRFCA